MSFQKGFFGSNAPQHQQSFILDLGSELSIPNENELPITPINQVQDQGLEQNSVEGEKVITSSPSEVNNPESSPVSHPMNPDNNDVIVPANRLSRIVGANSICRYKLLR